MQWRYLFTAMHSCGQTPAGIPPQGRTGNGTETNGGIMISVIIAEDHKLVRQGLKVLLTGEAAGVEIAGEAAGGLEAIELLEKQTADLVLMDIDMPGMNGIAATGIIKERFPTVKVLMLTMMENEQYLVDALRAGAQGYVLKSAGYKELLHAVRTVAGGEEYISTNVAKMLLRNARLSSAEATGAPATAMGQAADRPLPAAISPRELEVLRLIVQGHTNARIAELLFNSRRTIETHRQNLLEKTGTNNTATLVLYAVSHGLLT